MLNLSKSYIKSIKKNNIDIRYLPVRTYKIKSRYENVERIYNVKTGKTGHAIKFKNFYAETDQDKYFRVTKREENRLDIIAQDYYNDASKWWIIAYANSINNCFYVPIGVILRIPYITDLVL